MPDRNHGLSQRRKPSNATKADVFKSSLDQKGSQCWNGPELDVTVVPKTGEVPVHLSEKSEGKILQVAVIGRGQDCYPSWLDEVEQRPHIITWCIDMLDHFLADRDRKAAKFECKIVIG